MKLLVPSQIEFHDTRVPLTPQAVKKLTSDKKTPVEVLIQRDAGCEAGHDDAAYRDAGATLVNADDLDATWAAVDVVVTLHPPTPRQAGRLKAGAVLLGMLAPLKHGELIRALVAGRITSFSMEFVPRISRAQSMDVLSSQANIGGYKAVLMAANACRKMMPMLITAAGTLAPARVFVLGAGVAGLQAIATAKRLGAIVEAYDVRPAVKEQVQSLGARFVELGPTTSDAETAGGYAKEQTEEDRRRQIEQMARHVQNADAVIATAAIFGKAPPLLIPADTVRGMARGSIVVDIAADLDAGRGNCELTKPGERIVTEQGVVIDGTLNLPALLPVHASQAYANNMLAFLKEIIAPVEGDTPAATLKLDLGDEIQKGAAITHEGEITNDLVRTKLGA